MRQHYRFRTVIPLIGGRPPRKAVPSRSPLGHALAGTLTKGDVKRLVEDWERRSLPYTQLKPSGYLGAPWIDTFVAQGKSVTLCEDCFRKYWKWWERCNYKPIWAPKELTDCDGCARRLVYCTGFYPAGTDCGWAIHA